MIHIAISVFITLSLIHCVTLGFLRFFLIKKQPRTQQKVVVPIKLNIPPLPSFKVIKPELNNETQPLSHRQSPVTSPDVSITQVKPERRSSVNNKPALNRKAFTKLRRASVGAQHEPLFQGVSDRAQTSFSKLVTKYSRFYKNRDLRTILLADLTLQIEYCFTCVSRRLDTISANNKSENRSLTSYINNNISKIQDMISKAKPSKSTLNIDIDDNCSLYSYINTLSHEKLTSFSLSVFRVQKLLKKTRELAQNTRPEDVEDTYLQDTPPTNYLYLITMLWAAVSYGKDKYLNEDKRIYFLRSLLKTHYAADPSSFELFPFTTPDICYEGAITKLISYMEKYVTDAKISLVTKENISWAYSSRMNEAAYKLIFTREFKHPSATPLPAKTIERINQLCEGGLSDLRDDSLRKEIVSETAKIIKEEFKGHLPELDIDASIYTLSGFASSVEFTHPLLKMEYDRHKTFSPTNSLPSSSGPSRK